MHVYCILKIQLILEIQHFPIIRISVCFFNLIADKVNNFRNAFSCSMQSVK